MSRYLSGNNDPNASKDFPRSLDSFGRYRVSEPSTIFDSKQIADSQPLFWDDAATAGSGTSTTFNTGQASTTIAVSNLTAGTRVRQSKRWFNYQPGKSQLIFMTFALGASATGITRRVGQFETSNGLYLEQLSTGLGVVVRTSTSGSPENTRVAQASWNLDKLNGTGASGHTLDPTKTQILVIDYEWLGVGSVRMGFVIDGKIIYCHQFNNANVLSLVYMGSPNLPLRYEIGNDGTGAAATLVHICAQISSEGGQQASGFDFATQRALAPLVTLNDNDIYPLLSIRLQSTYRFATVFPRTLSVMCTSTSSYQWLVLMNPTITGTALDFTAIANSAIEADAVATNATKVTINTGTLIASAYGQAQATGESTLSISTDLSLGSTIAGVSDILVLAIRRLTGAAETFYGAMSWHEEK